MLLIYFINWTLFYSWSNILTLHGKILITPSNFERKYNVKWNNQYYFIYLIIELYLINFLNTALFENCTGFLVNVIFLIKKMNFHCYFNPVITIQVCLKVNSSQWCYKNYFESLILIFKFVINTDMFIFIMITVLLSASFIEITYCEAST